MGILRCLVTTESTWRQCDTDHNGVADFWTADVSGFYRIERRPGSGEPCMAVDERQAAADDAKYAAGAAIAARPVPGSSDVPSGLTAFTVTRPYDGHFWVRAIRRNAFTGRRYSLDPDGNGQRWTNAQSFAFQARFTDEDLNLEAWVVDESGIIYQREFDDHAPEHAEPWPVANPLAAGWRIVQ